MGSAGSRRLGEVQHDDEYGALVRKVLAAASIPQPDRIERAREGKGNHVYFAGPVVVRIGTGSDAAMFPRAIAITRAAAPTLPVPEVLFEDCSRSAFPFPVMVLARVPGEPLSRLWPNLRDDQRIDHVAAIISQVSRLHGLDPATVTGAGFTDPWWRERVSRIERLLVDLRPHPRFPDAWFESMGRYLDAHRPTLADAPPAVVLHNDINWGNVLINNGQLTALLDFDDALCGPPEEDWWQLAFRCIEADPPVPPERLRELPGFDLGTDGALERFKIGEIQNALDLLTGQLSWVDPETAIVEARETYEEAFESDRYERLLDRLT